MKYCAQYDENNHLTAIGTGLGGVEITEEEYNRLLAEIREKADYVNKVYSGEISLTDVPEDWQEEIQRRVDERIAQQGAMEDQDISAEEALGIILGE